MTSVAMVVARVEASMMLAAVHGKPGVNDAISASH
ncbi:Uncharacterised protein [Mycobacteroides abscessus subsp. abscessus]|nr:Uncharacterised protein [Mycobacteroides abscessus subsp. abscessus]